MEHVPGVILRARVPAGLEAPPATLRALAFRLVENLARLHALDLRAGGLVELGHPEGYVARQVHGWAARSAAASAAIAAAADASATESGDVPELAATFARLAERIPPQRGAALVHNDYKHDNVVLDPADLTRLRAVLDWEMATVGDPLLDLGTTLGYWVERTDPEPLRRFRFGPTDGEGQPSRAELVERYRQESGRDVSDAPFCYAFGLCKIAVIAQQIYVRYAQRLTLDPRFAALPAAIRALAAQANDALVHQRL
jgi:aminoglycoside phosphotransferase (APT) family kinase protein